MAIEGVYYSLDEARAELAERWANIELRRAIEAEAGKWLLPEFIECPRAILFRQLLSPENGFTFFHQCARYINDHLLAFASQSGLCLRPPRKNKTQAMGCPSSEYP